MNAVSAVKPIVAAAARPARSPAPAVIGKPVLALQGGGSLGSYQAGVFSALDAGGYCPQSVAGISIGAINGAIIAGNPRERRRERIASFWERVC